jgi:hypothetical protein
MWAELESVRDAHERLWTTNQHESITIDPVMRNQAMAGQIANAPP